TGSPLETRGLLVDYDPGRGHMTVWGATLVTHYHRRVLAQLLGLPLTRLTYPSTDSGGSLGVRGDFFPQDFLVAHLAVRRGRPLTEPRSTRSRRTRLRSAPTAPPAGTRRRLPPSA